MAVGTGGIVLRQRIVRLDGNGKIVGSLAKNWDVSADGKTSLSGSITDTIDDQVNDDATDNIDGEADTRTPGGNGPANGSSKYDTATPSRLAA